MKILTIAAVIILTFTANFATAKDIYILANPDFSNEIIKNGSFENNTNEWITDIKNEIITKGTQEGSKALKLSPNTTLKQTIKTNIKAGEIYKLKLSAKSGDAIGIGRLDLTMNMVYTNNSEGTRNISFPFVTDQWETKYQILIPYKDIKEISITCTETSKLGYILIDNISMTQSKEKNIFSFENNLYIRNDMKKKDYSRSETVYKTKDNFGVGFTDDGLATLNYKNERIYLLGMSGFFGSKTDKPSNISTFEPKEINSQGMTADNKELNTQLQCTVTSNENHIKIQGTINKINSSLPDENITLVYSLPIGANDTGNSWIWWSNPRGGNYINPNIQEYSNTYSDSNGINNKLPIGAINDGRYGIALGIDPNVKNKFKISYIPAMDNFQINFQLNNNNSNFSFIVYRFDLAWGFRSALAKYSQIFPDYFPNRLINPCIIGYAENIKNISNYQDFGFTYSIGLLNDGPYKDLISLKEIDINDSLNQSSEDGFIVSSNNIISAEYLENIQKNQKKYTIIDNPEGIDVFSSMYIDAIKINANWFTEDIYTPISDYQLLTLRTIAYIRPIFCTLTLNTPTTNQVINYLNTCIAYGMLPGFSKNYWNDLSLYGRDISILKKYINIAKSIAAAQWNPITNAESNNPAITVEKFGKDDADKYYITIHNNTNKRQPCIISVYSLSQENTNIKELINNSNYTAKSKNVNVMLGSWETLVFEIEK